MFDLCVLGADATNNLKLFSSVILEIIAVKYVWKIRLGCVDLLLSIMSLGSIYVCLCVVNSW